MNIDSYNALHEYLRHHTPMCSMMVERRSGPEQKTTFIRGDWRKGNSVTIGSVSAMTIVKWHPSIGNDSVEVETTNGTFKFDTISCECLAETFEDFYKMMLGDDIIVVDSYNDIRDFDVEYIGEKSFKCSYEDTSYTTTRKVEGFGAFQFKDARLFPSFFRVSYDDENGGYGGMIDIPIRLIAK